MVVPVEYLRSLSTIGKVIAIFWMAIFRLNGISSRPRDATRIPSTCIWVRGANDWTNGKMLTHLPRKAKLRENDREVSHDESEKNSLTSNLITFPCWFGFPLPRGSGLMLSIKKTLFAMWTTATCHISLISSALFLGETLAILILRMWRTCEIPRIIATRKLI